MRACFVLAKVRACFMIERVRTPSSPVRERKREKEGERCRIWPELLFLFLKGMTGALAPFSYLVSHKKRIFLYISLFGGFWFSPVSF